MSKTKHDLSERTRVQMTALFNARLADGIDLQTQTKQTHWNVKGPSFVALHELLDRINEDVEEHVDAIAERVVQLGGVAQGTARMVAKRSSLVEYPANLTASEIHGVALSSALADVGKALRNAIQLANELVDLDTADLFTEISREMDKWLWLVESHLPTDLAVSAEKQISLCWCIRCPRTDSTFEESDIIVNETLQVMSALVTSMISVVRFSRCGVNNEYKPIRLNDANRDRSAFHVRDRQPKSPARGRCVEFA